MKTAPTTSKAWKEIELVEPIQREGKTPITVLSLQEPCARHLAGLPAVAPTIGNLLDIGAAMAGLGSEIIDELCMEDYQSLMEPVGESMKPMAEIEDWSKVDAPEAPSTPHVLKLKSPFLVGKKEIDKISFNAPKAKHIRAMPADGVTFGDIMTIAGKLTGEPPSLIEKLSPEDFASVTELVMLFLIGSRPTGGE